MVRTMDHSKRSLLAFAAESGDKGTFKAVREFLYIELSENEEMRRFKP